MVVKDNISCHQVGESISRMAETGTMALDDSLRTHIDECKECWQRFVQARWSIADATIDIAELRAFLGPSFIHGIDSSWLLAELWNREPRTNDEDVRKFYRQADPYVYNLVIWKACGQRPQYVARAQPVLAAHQVVSVLDFGAGVGNDALEFAALGLKVYACDFDSEASRFLRWRAAKRELNIAFVDADDRDQLSSLAVDMLWLMDVIEHLPQPDVSLAASASLSRMIVSDTEHSGVSKGRHAFHFSPNVGRLLSGWGQLGFQLDMACSKQSRLRVMARNPCV